MGNTRRRQRDERRQSDVNKRHFLFRLKKQGIHCLFQRPWTVLCSPTWDVKQSMPPWTSWRYDCGWMASIWMYITGINPEAFRWGVDRYDRLLCPGLQPGPPSQTPGGLGQRYWCVSEVTWPPQMELRRWRSSGPSSVMNFNVFADMILPYGSHCIDMTPSPEPINGATGTWLSCCATCDWLRALVHLHCDVIITTSTTKTWWSSRWQKHGGLPDPWSRLAMLTEENLPSKYNVNEMKSM